MFKMRDFMFKIRDLAHFKHEITHFEHPSQKLVLPLHHQKRFLMVKVYG
jgi:hypothetical protein